MMSTIVIILSAQKWYISEDYLGSGIIFCIQLKTKQTHRNVQNCILYHSSLLKAKVRGWQIQGQIRRGPFTNYSSTCDLSLAIALCCTSEHKWGLVVSQRTGSLPRYHQFCEYNDVLARNQCVIRNQLVKPHRIIYNGECFSKKSRFLIPARFPEIRDSSSTLPPLHMDEHSWCYEVPQNRDFCPQIPIFVNRASF